MVFEHYKDALMTAIVEIGQEDSRTVFLDADLSSCIDSNKFQQAYPNRFYNCGIAEANMVGVAAGLSSMGLVPYVHSFGCFASRRVYDQLFLSVGYAYQTVHVIGSDPGITAQYNGGTHMPFEDIALMRQIPGMVIVEPSDDYSLYHLTKEIHKNGKASYTRTARKGVHHLYSEGTKIKLGKSMELSDGQDVAIVALGGLMVSEAMKAKDLLEVQGIKATVVDLLSVRPLDTVLMDKIAKRCGHVVVCENGRYAGGVGEMLAMHYASTNPIKMGFVNVGERFGEVGSLSYLSSIFNFTAENIATVAKSIL